MTSYRLCSHVEEFHCPECGAPVYVGEHAVEHEGDCFCSRHCAEVAAVAAFAPESMRSLRVGYRLESSPDVLTVQTPEPEEEPAEPIRRPARYARVVLAVSCPECHARRRTKCQDRSGYLPRARRFPCPARVEHAASVDALKRRGVWSPMIPRAAQQTLFDA
jgi:endogenous inhibitor of DNA gyrase (YacG/DUF329 family)